MKKNLFVFLISTISWGASGGSLSPEIAASYRAIHRALAGDNYTTAKEEAAALDTRVKAALETGVSGQDVPPLKKILFGTEKMLSLPAEALSQRHGFGDVAEGMVALIRLHPEIQGEWQLFRCPMASGYQFWVQPKGEALLNPYFGSEMLTCGSKKSW